MLFCQIIASVVAGRHPEAATVARAVRGATRRRVYVDYLQNIPGKTLACAYSARASAYAGVSTPLRWEEVDDKLDPRAFSIRTLPARLREVGDLWAGLRRHGGSISRRRWSARMSGTENQGGRDEAGTWKAIGDGAVRPAAG